MPDKLITVIMSTYNESEEYITLAVNSILNQSYSNIEFIIVCDNPNNNEIKSLLGHFQKEDKRIVIIENTQNIGLAESLNKAISISRGEYIARMDADDISHPRRLEVEVAFLEDNPDYGVVYTARQDIDEKGYKKDTSLLCPKNDKALLSSLSYGSIISHPTVMIRKKDLSVVGGYQNFPTGQDYDLWLRFRQKGIKFHFINQVLFYYRIRQNSISVSKKSLQWICSEWKFCL